MKQNADYTMQIVQWKIATLQTNTLRESKGRRSDDSTFYTSTQRPIKIMPVTRVRILVAILLHI